MSLGLLTSLILGWTVFLVIWSLIFLISSLKVMYDSRNSYHMFEYVSFNRHKKSVKLMLASFVALTILLALGIVILPLLS